MQKLKLVATALEAVTILSRHCSGLHRERDGLQIKFMGHIDGVKSYEEVRDRADWYEIGAQRLLAASLDDVIRSKRAESTASARSAALKRESDRALIELIRYRLSLAPEMRLNCLRRKIGLRATSL